jgi:hypothetical protein
MFPPRQARTFARALIPDPATAPQRRPRTASFPGMWGFGEEADERSYIQALRANPPGRAGTGRRRAALGAALQQFDELLSAASAVGPASAPLPLFYALSQAGRAIAAARLADNERWAFAGHGLTFTANREDPGSSTITPAPSVGRLDAYSAVADATGSAPLTGAVELAALWASLPILDVAPGFGEGLPRALHVAPHPYGWDSVQAELRLAEALLPEDEREEALNDRMAAYPGTDRLQVQRWNVVRIDHEDRDEGIVFLNWLDEAGAPVPISSVATSYLGRLDFYLWPGVGANADVLSPLMTWWALLYGLSHLARYEPAAWSKMLNRDRSALGIPIERGLRRARVFMPRVVLHALTGSWRA